MKKKEIRKKVFEKYNGKCGYCGNEITMANMQIDHIYPKRLGGANELDNYMPACRSCNFYKATFLIPNFKKEIIALTERLQKIFIVRLAIKFGIIEFKKWDGIFYFEKMLKEEVL